ncbi:hypothetical protein RJ639_026392 [Escallonia herrerae]|uniref:Uncharacterized protein n=1 Tax=Escallonia herrerae TaxID=1293975 RepID=A0AA89AC84_9ASTE|nr:hypothetical protein RJ639_026392 [Escallonia herrerae]
MIVDISSLLILDLPNNAIAGSLPTDLCYSIPIPDSLSHCKSLLLVSLSYNNFTGSIPRDIGNLSLLQEFYLGRNNLKGTIPPPPFCNIPMLETLTSKRAMPVGIYK